MRSVGRDRADAVRVRYELAGVRLADVYRDRDGQLWEVISLCDKPQATFRRVHDLAQVEHVIGCLNMQEQFPVGPLREKQQ